MALMVQKAGATLMSIQPMDGSSPLVECGISANGFEVDEEAMLLDVPGDEFGGDEGPPIDVQMLGLQARIRGELTKWDWAEFAKLRARVNNGTAGISPVPGTCLLGGSFGWRILLAGTGAAFSDFDANFVANFPRCVIREAVSLNRGTKYSRAVFEAVAYPDPVTGVVWNTDETEIPAPP